MRLDKKKLNEIKYLGMKLKKKKLQKALKQNK